MPLELELELLIGLKQDTGNLLIRMKDFKINFEIKECEYIENPFKVKKQKDDDYDSDDDDDDDFEDDEYD